MTSPPQDLRLFVVEQQSGLVKIVDGSGTILAQPFLDLSSEIATDHNERGLLSIAFAPDYATSGLVYAYLTPPGLVEVREYRRAPADPNRAEPTGRTIFSIDHSDNGNHNGGLVTFGPDGMLWAGVGDGGSGNDPPNNAQNPDVLLGKLLRVDPRGANLPAGREAIFALGLRNPWRFSFDRSTGDLIIGDVGQDTREEVDFAPASQNRLPGANYGWRCFEGSQPTLGVTPCDPPDDVKPVHELLHTDGACSITGGIVVRDPGLPTLSGRYLYGDICMTRLRSITLPGATDDRQETLSVAQVTTFAEDACGRVLVASLQGAVYRVVDGQPSPCSFPPPPAPGPGPPPPSGAAAPPDCGLTLRARSSRRSTVLRRGLAVRVGVRAACRVAATARIRGVGTLVARSRELVPGQRLSLRLRAGRRTRAALRRALRRRRSVTAALSVSARPTGGERRVQTRRVRIRR